MATIEKVKKEDTPIKVKLRSPNFPIIGLKQAVEKITAIYGKEQFAPAQRLAVLKHMGYTTENGASLTVLSALKKFDLINEEKGSILLTENARNIVAITNDHDERKVNALKDSALSPDIYRKLWEKYQSSGLPSDDSLSSELLLNYGFNAKVIKSFIANFRETLEYANIKSGDEKSKKINSENLDLFNRLRQTRKPMNETARVSEFKIPRANDRVGLFILEMPTTKDEIDKIKKWFNFQLDYLKETTTEEEEPVSISEN